MRDYLSTQIHTAYVMGFMTPQVACDVDTLVRHSSLLNMQHSLCKPGECAHLPLFDDTLLRATIWWSDSFLFREPWLHCNLLFSIISRLSLHPDTYCICMGWSVRHIAKRTKAQYNNCVALLTRESLLVHQMNYIQLYNYIQPLQINTKLRKNQ